MLVAAWGGRRLCDHLHNDPGDPFARLARCSAQALFLTLRSPEQEQVGISRALFVRPARCNAQALFLTPRSPEQEQADISSSSSSSSSRWQGATFGRSGEMLCDLHIGPNLVAFFAGFPQQGQQVVGQGAGVVYEVELPAGLLRARVECGCDSDGRSTGSAAHSPSGRPWQYGC